MSQFFDFIKTIFGTLMGAGLAFWSNWHFQKLQRNRANLSAGNMAIAILSRQFGDFVIFRAGFLNDIEDRNKFPSWLQIKPSLFQFSDNLRFDLPSLAFLSDGGNHDLLSKLMMAELKYHDLNNLITLSTEACDLRDRALVTTGLIDLSPNDLHRAEIAVDISLRAKCEALNQAMGQRAHNDAQVYRSAGEALQKMLSQCFDPKAVMPFTALGARADIIEDAMVFRVLDK
jgi:hypothetical protein